MQTLIDLFTRMDPWVAWPVLAIGAWAIVTTIVNLINDIAKPLPDVRAGPSDIADAITQLDPYDTPLLHAIGGGEQVAGDLAEKFAGYPHGKHEDLRVALLQSGLVSLQGLLDEYGGNKYGDYQPVVQMFRTGDIVMVGGGGGGSIGGGAGGYGGMVSTEATPVVGGGWGQRMQYELAPFSVQVHDPAKPVPWQGNCPSCGHRYSWEDRQCCHCGAQLPAGL